MIKYIDGNLLECDAPYIVHQCNCVSNTSSGLARAIFDKYPWADFYSTRKFPSIKGNIVVKSDGEKSVIGMLAQYYPGGPKPIDNEGTRIAAFVSCLAKIKTYLEGELDAIAFPHNIGCGLARGDWNVYEKLIVDFSNVVPNDVIIVKHTF